MKPLRTPDGLYQTGWGLLPSVTTILQATMDSEKAENLRKWRHKMDSLRAAGRVVEDGLERGKVIDSAITEFSRCRTWPTIPDEQLPYFHSIRSLVQGFNPTHTQTIVVHGGLGYAGTLDAIGCYLDRPAVLIDWKTSKRPQRPEWLTDYWLQVTAYAHAYHWLFPDHAPIKWLALGIGLKGYTRELYFKSWQQAQTEHLPQWLARLEAYQDSTAA